MKTENYAQKIIQQTEKAAADLEVLLQKYTDKKEEAVRGMTIRRLKDDSVIVCDQSDCQAPHWFERHTTEWLGEGAEGKRRLAATKGTVWVVDLSPSQFHVFETEPDADRCYQEQLHLDNRGASSPVRYVGGQRQPRRD